MKFKEFGKIFLNIFFDILSGMMSDYCIHLTKI